MITEIITEKVTFTLAEVRRVFEDAGLTVRSEYLGDGHTWIVINPHNGSAEPLVDCFRRYLAKRKLEIFLKADKLEIYNLFEK